MAMESRLSTQGTDCLQLPKKVIEIFLGRLHSISNIIKLQHLLQPRHQGHSHIAKKKEGRPGDSRLGVVHTDEGPGKQKGKYFK